MTSYIPILILTFLGNPAIPPNTMTASPVPTLADCRAEQLTFIYQFTKEWPQMNTTWTMECKAVPDEDS